MNSIKGTIYSTYVPIEWTYHSAHYVQYFMAVVGQIHVAGQQKLCNGDRTTNLELNFLISLSVCVLLYIAMQCSSTGVVYDGFDILILGPVC